MDDFKALGLDQNFNLVNSPVSQTQNFLSALQQDLLFELNPFAQPNLISKGSLNTISGGVLTLYDKTGGTKVLTYNPTTGVITILGTLQVQNSSTGTYSNIVIGGTSIITGTLSGGVLGTNLMLGGTINNTVMGTPIITGGTVNAGSYAVGGVAGFTGTGTYVKTVNFAGSTTTLGSIISTNGIVTTIS